MTSKIYVAFRFHGNFYHSYRGDTADELGFGKDIRIIRYLIQTLDELNEQGIPVRGTWDFENYFSLEQIMPAHCPDIITALQRRVAQGQDVMQLMSYNNGLVSAHTAREFEAAIRRALHNSGGSGLLDLFGEAGVERMVRPQEMMFTPIHLKLYRACGVEAISLFYSALPFNGFSNFIPPLSFVERYNPLTLGYPGIDETLALVPCYNTGDLIDHLSLRRWVKQMRREQEKLAQSQDLLLLIDMDADDDFWVGFHVPLLSGRFATIDGLKRLVENVADLAYVEFTTPGRYLKTHPPLRSVSIGQDTADGSFDGMASWAEKWSNHQLWTGLERARLLGMQTRRLSGEDLPADLQALLDESFELRVRLLSTTHFGMAAPVMNLRREGVARDLTRRAVENAAAAFERAAGPGAAGRLSLLDYARGEATEAAPYPARPSMGLVRLGLRDSAPDNLAVRIAGGQVVPSAVLKNNGRRDLLFVDRFEPGERRDYLLEAGPAAPAAQLAVKVSERLLENDLLQVRFGPQGQLESLHCGGQEFAAGNLLHSEVVYAGKSYAVAAWEPSEDLALGLVGVKRLRGSLVIKGGYPARFEREIMLAAGLPYLYITTRVVYPRTPDQGYDRGKAERLQRTWDNAWQAVMPCEISPALAGQPDSPLRVWKHNYCGHVSSFNLDYGRYSKNIELDSVNNQVTHGWVAVSDGRRGILAAPCADVLSGMAFCPLRTRQDGQVMRVRLNPFGSYWGRQYRYGTADTGLGNFLATAASASDHIRPYAPSYNGQVQEFRLLVAPYAGDAPPEALQQDAQAFAYPYLALTDGQWVAEPPHRSWEGAGLGEMA